MTRRFTGWHMTAIMVAFFGVVLAVNLVMARAAIGTFGGTVVDNSYVASQRYNGWLEQARAQDRLAWSVKAIPAGKRAAIVLIGPAGPLDTATVTATARHPLGRLPDRTLTFDGAGKGRYLASTPLPPGRWLLNIRIRSGGNEARYERELTL